MKLFILRWNPNISSFKNETYQEIVKRAYEMDQFPVGMNWSIRDWEKANRNDIFILQQVGTDNDGFVMIGKFSSDTYEEASWRKDGSKVHYADLGLFTIFDRNSKTSISADEYERIFSFTKWHGGHSGEVIEGQEAEDILEKLSKDLIKEKLWDKNTLNYFKEGFICQKYLDEKIMADDFIKKYNSYNPVVHTNKDKEFDWLEDGCYSICIKTPSGDDLFADFEGEISLYFGGWHAHYESTDVGYETLIKRLNSILSNETCVVNAKIDEENWLGGMMLENENLTANDQDYILKELAFIGKKEINRMKKEHGTIQVSYWNPDKSFEIKF